MPRSITHLILSTARKSQVLLTEIMQPFGLTAAEQPFFMALLHREGLTQEQLTDRVGVDKSATARAVKSLEGKGLLTRVQDEDDRRCNRLYPTDTARQLYPQVRAALDGFNRYLVRDLNPREVSAVWAALARIESGLTRDRKGGGQDE